MKGTAHDLVADAAGFADAGASASICGDWWVHDSLHVVNGEDCTGPLVIEHLFHGTLIVTGALVLGDGLPRREARGAAVRPPGPKPAGCRSSGSPPLP